VHQDIRANASTRFSPLRNDADVGLRSSEENHLNGDGDYARKTRSPGSDLPRTLQRENGRRSFVIERSQIYLSS